MIIKPKQNLNKEQPSLSLPLEVSTPSDSLSDYAILLYGREKIGKTTFAAQFPDAFFLMFEPGGKSLSIYQKYVNNWAEFIGYISLLKKERRFKTIVVDTVDISYKMCYEHVCKKLGIDHPSEEGWSKAWNMIRDEFQKHVAALLKLRRGVICISHATEREIKKRYGEVEHRIIPTMTKQARDTLEPMVDIWAYMEYDENGGRHCVIRGDQMISAGHRLQEHFKGVDRIPMGKSPHDAYINFMDAFHNNTQHWAPTMSGKVKIKRRSI